MTMPQDEKMNTSLRAHCYYEIKKVEFINNFNLNIHYILTG